MRSSSQDQPKRRKYDTLWLLAFLNKWAGELSRSFPLGAAVSNPIRIYAGASPGGIGGILFLGSAQLSTVQKSAARLGT